MQLLVTHQTQEGETHKLFKLGKFGWWVLKVQMFVSPMAEVKGLYIGVQAVLALYAQWVRETRGKKPKEPGTCFFLYGDNSGIVSEIVPETS